MHQAIAAGNHLAVLSRQLTPYNRKNTKKDCRGGVEEFRIKGLYVFVCTRRSPQVIPVLVLSRASTQYKRKQTAFKRNSSSPTRQKKDKGDIYVVPVGTRKCLYLLTTVPVGFERTVLVDNGEIEVVVIFSRIFFPVFRIIFIVDIGKFCAHAVDHVLCSVKEVFYR